MNKYSRILAALLLAGGAYGASACGGSSNDDDTKSDAGNGDEKDGGTTEEDAGDDSDAGGEETDAETGKPDAGGSSEVEMLDKCPTHPNVKDDSKAGVCTLVAPKGNEIKTALSLKPVKNRKGYLLSGVVYVGEDVGGGAQPTSGKARVTLSIGPGTILAGADASSALAVNRGSKLEAVGTAEDPVVFTSVKTLAGEKGSAPTDWGGVVLMGRAPQNKGNDPITELDTGSYGGPDAEDSSGTLKYVRVEFTGSRSSSTKEFNGVTFYAVGSKTTVDYVHVHAGSDDAMEFFGGTVNAKHLVLTGGGDDGIDWTDGFKGKIQFAVVQQYPNFGDNGIEANNQETDPSPSPVSEPTVSNVTFIGNNTPVTGNKQFGALLRVGTKAHISNALFLNFTGACLSVDADSAPFIGSALTVDHSRISCTTSFGPVSAGTTGNTKGAEDLFKAGTDNKVLADKDVLKGAFKTNADYDFTPADGADLKGGETPSDDFFEKVDFIGAFGSENWIKGNWVKIVDFEPK